MRVFVPGPLRSYTGKSEVEAAGSTLGELLQDLDRRFPGMRFRMIDEQDGIRQHIKLFVNRELATDLNTPLQPGDELQIICAISGG
jgi:molybdopterin converting factor small subunit